MKHASTRLKEEALQKFYDTARMFLDLRINSLYFTDENLREMTTHIVTGFEEAVLMVDLANQPKAASQPT